MQVPLPASAVVYLTNGRLILAPVSFCRSGLPIATDPRRFGRSVKKAILASALAEVLAASRRDLPDPDAATAKRHFIPFQDAAEVKNFKTFMRDAKSVDIEREGDTLTLTPLANLGVNNGFEPIESEAVTVPAGDLDGAAGAVLTLLGLRPAS